MVETSQRLHRHDIERLGQQTFSLNFLSHFLKIIRLEVCVQGCLILVSTHRRHPLESILAGSRDPPRVTFIGMTMGTRHLHIPLDDHELRCAFFANDFGWYISRSIGLVFLHIIRHVNEDFFDPTLFSSLRRDDCDDVEGHFEVL